MADLKAPAKPWHVDVAAAARRLAGVVRRTPLVPFAQPDGRFELRLKLECQQVTGSFKARGAWNQVAQLTPEERQAGVVTVSSGNHGKAVAWAAERAGVRATVVMPQDAYPNKIQACRDHGAEVLLVPKRELADAACAEIAARGAVLVHPYDAARTLEGAGTVALEVCEDWPEVEVLIVPIGGGGLIGGCAVAARAATGRKGREIVILGSEPAGAPTMTRALAEGRPVLNEPVTSRVQGLCPPGVGAINLALAQKLVEGVLTLPDEAIFAAQAELVRRGGWSVEPAGAAAAAVLLAGRLADALPERLLAGRGARDPVRVCAVVSGGNPDPQQLAQLLAS
jgi:threonine dehydratase